MNFNSHRALFFYILAQFSSLNIPSFIFRYLFAVLIQNTALHYLLILIIPFHHNTSIVIGDISLWG